jgi:hypothetical protein
MDWLNICEVRIMIRSSILLYRNFNVLFKIDTGYWILDKET